jgi:beta-lactamase class A
VRHGLGSGLRAAGWLLYGLAVTHAGAISAAQDPKLAAAASAIESLIRDSGADVAVAYRTLDGRQEWLLRADEPFHAASTMKVPVLIELFDQQRQGKLRLDEPLLVKNEFHSIADGSSFTLDAADDSETDLYQAVGQERSLSQLAELMVTVSSNLATNLLIDKLGVEHIRATVHGLNADGMVVLRGVEDGKAFQLGLNNTTTARALLRLFTALAQGQAVDRASSRQMIEILERQTFNDGIPAGVPHTVHVAHKTGEITKVHHDAGIVYAPRVFVLVILTRGLADRKDSATLIASITREIYDASQ